MGSVVSKVLETWKWWTRIGAQISVFDPVTSQSFQKYTCLNAHNLSRKFSQGKCKRIRALKDKDEEDEKSRRRTVSGAN